MAGFEQIVVALGSPTGDRSLVAYAALLARLGAAREVRFAHVADPSESSTARALVFEKYQPRYDGDLTSWRETALPVALDLA